MKMNEERVVDIPGFGEEDRYVCFGMHLSISRTEGRRDSFCENIRKGSRVNR